jgi:hypothetical protein
MWVCLWGGVSNPLSLADMGDIRGINFQCLHKGKVDNHWDFSWSYHAKGTTLVALRRLTIDDQVLTRKYLLRFFLTFFFLSLINCPFNSLLNFLFHSFIYLLLKWQLVVRLNIRLWNVWWWRELANTAARGTGRGAICLVHLAAYYFIISDSSVTSRSCWCPDRTRVLWKPLYLTWAIKTHL